MRRRTDRIPGNQALGAYRGGRLSAFILTGPPNRDDGAVHSSRGINGGRRRFLPCAVDHHHR